MNPYEVLGVQKDCDSQEIKKAYRKLSLLYHPDRNQTEEAKQKILDTNAAYESIGDPESRQRFDAEANHPLFHGFPGFGGGGGGEEHIDIGNIFNMMFNQGGMGGMGGATHVFHSGGGHGHGHFFQQQMQKPPPIMKNILISLEQSFNGCSISIQVERWIIQNNMKVSELINLNIQVPQGVDSNEFIILRDQGNVINNDIKGDIKIGINIQNTTAFIRNGLDLILKKKISLKEALCGFSFDVQHIDGQNLCLNNKTNSTVIKPNFRKEILNMGMKKENTRGNLIIEFEIDFPNTLTPEQIKNLGEIL
jgi:DnaJ-class molecular chaperone